MIKLASLKVSKVTLQTQDKSIYPDFHRPFADGKIHLFYFFSKISNDHNESYSFIKWLTDNGYKKVYEGAYLRAPRFIKYLTISSSSTSLIFSAAVCKGGEPGLWSFVFFSIVKTDSHIHLKRRNLNWD